MIGLGPARDGHQLTMGLTAPLRKLDDRVLGNKLRKKPPPEQVDPPVQHRAGERVGAAPASRRSGNGVRKTIGIIYRVSRLVLLLLALVVLIAIAFTLTPTNPDNPLVRTVLDLAATIAGPLQDVFTVADDPKRQLAVNYTVTAVLYVLAGLLVTRLPGSDD